MAAVRAQTPPQRSGRFGEAQECSVRAGVQVHLVHEKSHEFEAATRLGHHAAAHTRPEAARVAHPSKTSAPASSMTRITIGSLVEEEPCWMAFVTASLMASFT